jgi:hypothetical protein
MECHHCKHRAEIKAGKYATTRFRRTPCGKCELRENSIRTMEVDLDRPVYDPGKGGPSQPVYDRAPFPEEADATEAKMPVGVMEELVARLLSLPRELRDVVCWRFTGLTYPEIARKQRITTAGAEVRHKRAMRLFPELRELFIAKMARKKMRQALKTVAVGGA